MICLSFFLPFLLGLRKPFLETLHPITVDFRNHLDILRDNRYSLFFIVPVPRKGYVDIKFKAVLYRTLGRRFNEYDY